jgi:predicted RNase H-like HicB family nuclease
VESSRFVCILSVQFSRIGEEFIAHCPELRLTDHGATEQQAEARLRAAVTRYVEICVAQGTLIKVLRDRGVLELEGRPEHFIQVPIPVSALEGTRPAVS